MNLKHLKITREEYINILKNRGITVPDNISTNNLFKKVKYEKMILDILQILEVSQQLIICLVMTWKMQYIHIFIKRNKMTSMKY